ncbi:hypothetical protein ES705_38545 [subsurface metagenome]
MKTYVKTIHIDKPIKKKINIETILLILFLIIIFTVPFIINQKKELPDGTLMSRNRFNGQISIGLINNEFTHFQKDNPLYKEMLDMFNNH